jgi:transposase
VQGQKDTIEISLERYEFFLSLEANNQLLKTEAQKFAAQLALLKAELEQLKRMIFGARRERYEGPVPEQGTLFDLPVREAEPEVQEVTVKRSKKPEAKQPVRAELAPHLPRVEEVIEPQHIPEGAKKIGEAITEVLEYEPASIYVRKIVRPKYAVPTATTDVEQNAAIVIAELPALPLPKSNAGAGLLAQLIVSKYVDHQPFYRQKKILERQNVHIAESTIGNWYLNTCELLRPLGDALLRLLLESGYLMVDETPIPVLTQDKPGATHKGYMWVYYDPLGKLVLFRYHKSRGREAPDELLANYKGYLQTDGYAAYDNLSNQANITHLACMAHARRKFEQSLDNDRKRADYAMQRFQELYAIERRCKEESLSFEQIYALRQQEAVPILQQLEHWLKEQLPQVTPQSAIGKAIAYTLRLWPRLVRYTAAGHLRIDNNLIENAIRPVALGRKNYLFAGSHDAAERAALIYSLLATCKINNIEPWQWLKDTLNKIPTQPINRIHELLPKKQS